MVLETTPIFLSIGPINIYYYGLVYALTFLAAYTFLTLTHKKHSLTQTQIDSLFIYLLIGLLIGGRFVHFLISQPMIFFTQPLELLYIWHGGMSFFGALLGITFSFLLFSRHNKLSHTSFFQVADILAIVTSGGLIFGRLANFLNQELVGTIADPSRIWWCVEFATASGCRHPYQLYAAASQILLFVIVLYMYTRKSASIGTAFWTFLLGYCILRFIVDFWRDDPSVLIGLTSWQFICIGIFAVGLFIHLRIKKHKRNY